MLKTIHIFSLMCVCLVQAAGDVKDKAAYNEDPLVKLMKRITRVNFDKDRRLVSARQLRDYLLGLDVKSSKTPKQIFDAIDSLQNVLYER